MTKTDKELRTDLKENTRIMYERTIEEMKKRGSSEQEIEVVERAKKEALDAYDNDDAPIQPKANAGSQINVVLDMVDKAAKGLYEYSPMQTNMFIVKLSDIPVYLFQTIAIDIKKKELAAILYESPKFSPLKYFSENKKFNCMRIEHINSVGEILRVDNVNGLKVKNINVSPLSYTTNDVWATEITFKYSKYVPSAD